MGEREQPFAASIPVAYDRGDIVRHRGKAVRCRRIVQIMKSVADPDHRARTVRCGVGGKGKAGHASIILCKIAGKAGGGATEGQDGADCSQHGAAFEHRPFRPHPNARINIRTATTVRKRPNRMLSWRLDRACAMRAPHGAVTKVAGPMTARPIRLT
jgi:hypothetical protein